MVYDVERCEPNLMSKYTWNECGNVCQGKVPARLPQEQLPSTYEIHEGITTVANHRVMLEDNRKGWLAPFSVGLLQLLS